MKMESNSIYEMEKFNCTNFELWKVKMEDLLVDSYLWVVVFGTKPIVMKYEEWAVLQRHVGILIMLCLANLVL